MRVCIDSRKYRVAIEYAEPVLAKHPDDYRLRLVVASLYSAIGRPERARDHYAAVVKDHPDDSTAHFALGVLYRDELKDRVREDAHFREYLRLEPEGKHAEEARAGLLKTVGAQ